MSGDVDPRAMYANGLLVLNDMVAAREQHIGEAPGCGADPMCMGPEAMMSLASCVAADPTFAPHVLLVAVGEVSNGRQRVEAQRSLAAAQMVELEKLTERVRILAAEKVRLTDMLNSAQAELTLWEDSADSIGPVGMPTEEDR